MTLTEYFASNARLQREWAFDKNTISPDELTPYARTKVWWRCSNGHEWQNNLDSRVVNNRNCPYCVNQSVTPGENDLSAVAPEIARLWHPTRNGELNPTEVTAGSGKKVWWRCEKNHEWQATVYSVTAGSACPYCIGKKPIVGETDLATTHPYIINMWSERNALSPTELTAGSQKRAWFVCEKGHEWETSVSTVTLLGCGCPYCTGKRAIPGETDLATLRPDILAEWDHEKNAGMDPANVLPSSHEKVWWKCEHGHSWQAKVFARTRDNGTGCPYCSGRKILPGFNDLATRKPKLAGEWHPTLNGDLTPADVTLGSNKKVWWQCSEGHAWNAYIYARTKANGSGCPVCAGKVKLPAASRRARPTVAANIYPGSRVASHPGNSTHG